MGTAASILSYSQFIPWNENIWSNSLQDGFKNGLQNHHKATKTLRHVKAPGFNPMDRSMSGILRKESAFIMQRNDFASNQRMEASVSRRDYPASTSRLEGSMPRNRINSHKSFNLVDTNYRDINENFGLPNTRSKIPAIKEQLLGSKLFEQDAWPPVDLVSNFITKLNSVPTTIIVARFCSLPEGSSDFIEMYYSFNKYTKETVFETSGNIVSLVSLSLSDVSVGESRQDQIDFFFKILPYCLNELDGDVWWNGYSIISKPVINNRLKVTGLELEPSQIVFETPSGMNNLQVHRGSAKVELQLQKRKETINNNSETKYFHIRGTNSKEVKVNKLGGHLIAAHLPEFTLDNPSKSYD